MNKSDVGHLVFLDENGVNTNMTRLYGRGIGQARVEDHTPLNTPKPFSRRYGSTEAEQLLHIPADWSKICRLFEDQFIPTLEPGDVVVMDNLRSHHVAAVQETFEGTGFHLAYLPPYSPDFNPIEKMWSKMKSILRKVKVRDLEELPAAFLSALNHVTFTDSLHWFASCGYCQ